MSKLEKIKKLLAEIEQHGISPDEVVFHCGEWVEVYECSLPALMVREAIQEAKEETAPCQ